MAFMKETQNLKDICSPPSKCVLNTRVFLCIVLKTMFFCHGNMFFCALFSPKCVFFRNVSCAVFLGAVCCIPG